MTRLIEITPGAWVRLEQVTSVIAFNKSKLTPTPSVQVKLVGRDGFSWDFETYDGAKSWAAKIATAINDGRAPDADRATEAAPDAGAHQAPHCTA